MALTPSDLEAVNAAIASGELTIRSSDGKTITMRTIPELLQARETILADMRASGSTPRTSLYSVANFSD